MMGKKARKAFDFKSCLKRNWLLIATIVSVLLGEPFCLRRVGHEKGDVVSLLLHIPVGCLPLFSVFSLFLSHVHARSLSPSIPHTGAPHCGLARRQQAGAIVCLAVLCTLAQGLVVVGGGVVWNNQSRLGLGVCSTSLGQSAMLC